MSANWDAILSGEPDLGTKIFLGLEMETLANAELVCKSWRRHIIDNAVWRQKLAILARSASYDAELFGKDIADCDGDKEKLSKRCRSLCRNMALRLQWLDPGGKVRLTKRQITGEGVGGFTVTPEDNVMYAIECAIWLTTTSAPNGEEWCVLGRSLRNLRKRKLHQGSWEHEHWFTNRVDVHGDHAVVGSSLGAIAICDWRQKTWLPKTRVFTGDCVWEVKFSREGDCVVSVDGLGKCISIWAFTGSALIQKQQLEVMKAEFFIGKFDLSSRHLMVSLRRWSQGHFLSMYAMDEDTGNYTETKAVDDQTFCTDGVLILRSVPGGNVGVVAHDRSGVRVWDLDKGELVREVTIFLKEPEDYSARDHELKLSDCLETGILAVGHYFGDESTYVALVSTADLVAGTWPVATVIAVPCYVYLHPPPLLVATPSKVYLLYTSYGVPEQELFVVENESAESKNANGGGDADDESVSFSYPMSRCKKTVALNLV